MAGVVFISGIFCYYLEAKSASTFLAFRDLIPRSAVVTRGGCKVVCPATDIVVGDLIDVKAGDRVPADVRLVESHDFRCVNLLQTGNLRPFAPTNQCTHSDALSTENLVFFSTECVQGMTSIELDLVWSSYHSTHKGGPGA